MVAGLSSGVVYAIWAPPQLPVASRVLTTIAFSGPPLVAGILFVTHRRAVMAFRKLALGHCSSTRSSD